MTKLNYIKYFYNFSRYSYQMCKVKKVEKLCVSLTSDNEEQADKNNCLCVL